MDEISRVHDLIQTADGHPGGRLACAEYDRAPAGLVRQVAVGQGCRQGRLEQGTKYPDVVSHRHSLLRTVVTGASCPATASGSLSHHCGSAGMLYAVQGIQLTHPRDRKVGVDEQVGLVGEPEDLRVMENAAC